MKRVVLTLFLMFLVFGIVNNVPFIMSDEDDNRSGSNSGSDSNPITANDDSDEDEINDNNEDDEENETEDEDKNKSRIRERTREIRREGNCTIKIEREIRIEGGKRFESVKRKIECADGRKEEIKIKVENRTEDGRFRERIRYEIKGEEIEVEAEDEINIEEQTNGTEYRLKARLRNGNVTEIKIMPDVASEIALERLKALNFTVELREIIDRERNVPRVVYNIETNKHGRFLGVFKLALKVEGQVDPETGEFLGTSKPWWAFLVAGEDSDQTGDDDGTDEEENETEINQTTVNILEQNNSDEFGIATLVEESGQVTVTLSLEGFTQDVSQPAHIHVGSCPGVGSVSYPLTNVLNGASITTLNVTLDQLEDELPLAINVHKSVDEAGVYVSCGNLEF